MIWGRTTIPLVAPNSTASAMASTNATTATATAATTATSATAAATAATTQPRKRGRPKGSKDKEPRKRRQKAIGGGLKKLLHRFQRVPVPMNVVHTAAIWMVSPRMIFMTLWMTWPITPYVKNMIYCLYNSCNSIMLIPMVTSMRIGSLDMICAAWEMI